MKFDIKSIAILALFAVVVWMVYTKFVAKHV